MLRGGSRGKLVLAPPLVAASGANPLQVPHHRRLLGRELLGVDTQRKQQLLELIGSVRPLPRETHELAGTDPEIARDASDLFRPAAGQIITQARSVAVLLTQSAMLSMIASTNG